MKIEGGPPFDGGGWTNYSQTGTTLYVGVRGLLWRMDYLFAIHKRVRSPPPVRSNEGATPPVKSEKTAVLSSHFSPEELLPQKIKREDIVLARSSLCSPEDEDREEDHPASSSLDRRFSVLSTSQSAQEVDACRRVSGATAQQYAAAAAKQAKTGPPGAGHNCSQRKGGSGGAAAVPGESAAGVLAGTVAEHDQTMSGGDHDTVLPTAGDGSSPPRHSPPRSRGGEDCVIAVLAEEETRREDEKTGDPFEIVEKLLQEGRRRVGTDVIGGSTSCTIGAGAKKNAGAVGPAGVAAGRGDHPQQDHVGTIAAKPPKPSGSKKAAAAPKGKARLKKPAGAQEPSHSAVDFVGAEEAAVEGSTTYGGSSSSSAAGASVDDPPQQQEVDDPQKTLVKANDPAPLDLDDGEAEGFRGPPEEDLDVHDAATGTAPTAPKPGTAM